MCIRKCLLFRLNFDQLLHPWFHYTHGVEKRIRRKHVNARWERGRKKMMRAYNREVGEIVFQTQTGLPSILYLLTIRCYKKLSYIFFPKTRFLI